MIDENQRALENVRFIRHTETGKFKLLNRLRIKVFRETVLIDK